MDSKSIQPGATPGLSAIHSFEYPLIYLENWHPSLLMGDPLGKKAFFGHFVCCLGNALFELIMVRHDIFIEKQLVILICYVDSILAFMFKGSLLFIFIAIFDAIVVRALILYHPGHCEGIFLETC